MSSSIVSAVCNIDGSTTTEYKNGSVITKYPNGKVVCKFYNGIINSVDEFGTLMIIHPLRTIIYYKDGTTSVFESNGDYRSTSPRGTVRTINKFWM
jgi:hypothetical protein